MRARSACRPPPFAVDADRTAARFASWYELFPRSMSDDRQPPRHVRRRDPPPAAHPRHGLRRALFPADPSDRPDQPQGPQQHADAGAGRSRQPLRDRLAPRAATTRSIPSSARSRISAAWSRPRAAHGLEIALDFAIQCSPDHPWLKQHPDWFDWRPDGIDQLRREPAEEIRGHRQRRFLRRRARCPTSGSRCATWCCSGSSRACASSASTIRTPSRCRSGNG